MNLSIPTLGDSYPTIISLLRSEGEKVSPRGIDTVELRGFQLCIQDVSRDVLPTGWGRGVNPRIAILEAMQLVCGESYPALLVEHAPNFKQFMDGQAFHGAYGPRIRSQIPSMIDTFTHDFDTRQGVLTIWDPAIDGRIPTKDQPCTISLQFLVRHNKLDLVVNMRSNDVWWGLPYDVYQFSSLQRAIACTLGCDMGSYTHNVGSMHMYARDFEAADNMYKPRDMAVDRTALIYHAGFAAWDTIVADAKAVLDNSPTAFKRSDQLRRYLHGVQ